MRRFLFAAVLLVVLVGAAASGRSALAADGSGTNLVSPTTANAGSTGNTFDFTYTAAETASSGELSVTVPGSWSAPQGSAGTAGYVTATSAGGVLADVLNALDSAAGWSYSQHMALSADTGDAQEGSASLLNTIDSGASANEQWYFNYGGATNWGTSNSGSPRMGMFLKSSVGTSSGDLSWRNDDSASLGSPQDTVAVPALTANTWTYVSEALGGARTSVLSYGFRYTTDLGAMTVRSDAISALFDDADATTSWGGSSANVTTALQTTGGNFKEGTGAIRCTFAAGAGVGDNCRRTAPAVSDFVIGPGTTVGFWARSSVALSAGDFQWLDDTSNNLGSPEDTVDLPALAANTWTYVTLTAANSANKSVRGYGFSQAVDKGAFTLDIDAIGKQVDSADSTSGWATSATSGQSISADAVTFHEGAASLKNVVASGAVAGDKWYQALGSTQNWSAYTTVGFWIRSTVATSAGDLKYEYSSASDLSSPIASLNVGALTANTWSYQTFALTGTRTSVNSYGINYATDVGAATIYLDDVLIGPGVPTFPGGGVIKTRLLSLTTGQTAVITYGSGGGTSGATAPTATGVSTFTTQSRVSDSGTLTNIASSPTVTVNAAATSQFALNDPGNITAGNRAAYVVTRKDQFGNLVTSGAQTVYLYSDSTGANDKFYDAASGGNIITSISIADGSSTASFWYYDDLATTATVTASDNATAPDGTTNVDDATDSITVSAAATSQFTLNDPGNITAGNRAAYVVTRKDAFGNVTTSGSQTAYLYSDSAGANDKFYDAASGGNIITSVAIADTASTANFWYYDDLATTATVTASDNATAPDGTTGIDDAADSVTVSAAATSQFTLNDPGNITAGNRAAYVVTRRDQFGNVTTSGAQTGYLYSDSAGANDKFYDAASDGSQITSVSIADASSAASFWYYDDLATTATVTASDNATAPDGTTGIDDATDSVTVSAAATSQFLLNDPGNIVAGNRAAYVVTRRDQFNNLVTSGAQTVYLYSDSTGANDKFYDAASGGNIITSIAISAAASTASFWYYDDLATTATVTASDNVSAPDGTTGIDDATDSVTVSAAATSQFLLNDPGNIVAGNRAAYVVTRRDQFNNLVTSGAQTVYLYSDSAGTNKAFYNVSTGGSPVASVSIADASSAASFWYYDDLATTATVTASDNATAPDGTTNIDDATDSITVSAAATSQFLLNDPGNITAGNRAAYVVTRKDQFGNVTTSGAQTVYLYSDSVGTNDKFYDAASGGNIITSVVIADAASTASFWYYDELATTATVTASDNATAPDGTTGIDDATDSVTVSAAVTSQFLLNDPGNISAGNRAAYVVSRYDLFGNPTTAGAQTVYLYSDSAGANDRFYDAASGGSQITSVAIADTSSAASFWYYDDLATTATVTASDNAAAPDGTTGIDDATDSVTVSAAATSQFLLNDPGGMVTGTRIGYVVTRKDAFGNLVTSGTDTAYPYSDSTGSYAFYDAASGGSLVISVDMTPGNSTAGFWYYEESPGTITITASDNAVAPDGATGIDDGTDGIVVSMPAAVKYVILEPTDATIETASEVTVRAEDGIGNLASVEQRDVTLVTDGSATGGGLVSIVNGIGTISISDAVVETVNLSLSDTEGTGLDVTSTKDVAFVVGPTRQFALSDPGGMTAGTRIGYVVSRKDLYGNAVTSGTDTAYLYSDSTGNYAFFDAASGGSEIASVDVTNGNATAEFWYGDDAAATVSVAASDNAAAPDGTAGIDDATDGVAVLADVASEFLLNDPGGMTAGTRLGYFVTRRDQFGNLVTSGGQDVYLYSDSTGNALFYDAAVDGNLVDQVSIADGNSTESFWYYDDKVAVVTVTASDSSAAPDGTTGINDASDSPAISAAATSQFLLDDPGNMTTNTRLGYVVTRRDAFGNLVTAGTDTAYLYTTSAGTAPTFYDAAVDGNEISSADIEDGASTANFWYFDDVAGNPDVTASDNSSSPDGDAGIDDDTDPVTVSDVPIVATRFVILDPGDGIAGEDLEVTVRAEDDFGSVDTTIQSDVTLELTDSATGAGLVDIVNGVGTRNISDTVAETIAASLSDTEGTGLDVTSTRLVTFDPGLTAQYLLNDPVDTTAGTRIAYEVTRKDEFGNLVTAGSETAYLFSEAGSPAAFYDAASGGSQITSVTITGGSSAASFWYASEQAGDDVVTVTDNPGTPDGTDGIDDGTDAVAVSAGLTSRFLLNDPGDMSAGTRIGYVVSREDEFGNLVTAGSQTAYLYTTSTETSPAFYDAASGGSEIGSVAIGDGSSEASFWYFDDTEGAWTVTASDNALAADGDDGVDDATDSVEVTDESIVATRFVILEPDDATVGDDATITVRAEDDLGAVDTSYQLDVTLVLGGSATGGGLVDVVNGIGEMVITDDVVETVPLSLSDTEGTGLDASSAADVQFLARRVHRGTGAEDLGVPIPPEEPVVASAPTVLRLDGLAYPGATATLIGRRDDGTSVSLAQTVVVSRDGTFVLEYAGPFDGIASYDLSVADAQGLEAPTAALSTALPPNETTTLTHFAPPTTDLVRSAVLRGLPFHLFGYATPGSLVGLSVDGADPDRLVRVGDDGSYRVVLESLGLDFGPHELRVRQVAGDGTTSGYGTQKTAFVSRILNKKTDLNGDDAVNVIDWSIFLSRWSSLDASVRSLLDFNGDGAVDISDFSIFIRSIRH